MSWHRFRIAIAFLLGSMSLGASAAYAMQYADSQYGGQDRGSWDAPPTELQQIQRQGFRDGIIGAQKDFDNHRQPDPNNRDQFRHPNLPRDEWDAYRDGFRRGYARGFAHLTGQDQPAMRGPDRDGREMGPGPGMEVRRRGFQDGLQGALSDLDNHRRPDPSNRDEFRHPSVPGELQDAYRDGFRDGYQEAMEALTGGWEREGRDQGPVRDIRIRGLHDGVEGAIRDLDNNRQPDPNNRDQYRNPHVPYGLEDPYRDAFRRGYERVVSDLAGYPNRR